MKRPRKIPKFRSDREAADFWATHDSSASAAHLEEVRATVSPALKRRIAARPRTKKPITLRLDPAQIAAAKRAARRKSLPYQTLLRMWIAEGLAKDRAG